MCNAFIIYLTGDHSWPQTAALSSTIYQVCVWTCSKDPSTRITIVSDSFRDQAYFSFVKTNSPQLICVPGDCRFSDILQPWKLKAMSINSFNFVERLCTVLADCLSFWPTSHDLIRVWLTICFTYYAFKLF